jgi:hypothetical protein
MEMKELLSKNVEGLDESLVANAIIADEPIHDITMMAASIHKQLENKPNE